MGYPPGALRELDFAECDLLDFTEPQVAEYTRHWCTAVRLAQNESEEEAQREGDNDGKEIVEGFGDNPYIRDLARNPLMLSAVCLVRYFEGGELPQDRSLLYRLCVEGLLHNWDQRRGIHSEFTLEEKLRVCREVALSMQAEDRAEFSAEEVLQVFDAALPDPVRARSLLEHVRYRTGLLLERRPGIFAFAHLTFQEYLAASAVHEGNQVGVTADTLVKQHGDGRWQEVIALFCGLATAQAARTMVAGLVAQPNTEAVSTVLTEAYLSAGPVLFQDAQFREVVLKRIATAPGRWPGALERFPEHEVAPIAIQCVGTMDGERLSQAHHWLFYHGTELDSRVLLRKLQTWRIMGPNQVDELVHLLHKNGSDEALAALARKAGLYKSPAIPPQEVLAQTAWIGLAQRRQGNESLLGSPGVDAAFLRVLRVLTDKIVPIDKLGPPHLSREGALPDLGNPMNPESWPMFVSLARRLADRLEGTGSRGERIVNGLRDWADGLDNATRSAQTTPQRPHGKRSPRSTGEGSNS